MVEEPVQAAVGTPPDGGTAPPAPSTPAPESFTFGGKQMSRQEVEDSLGRLSRYEPMVKEVHQWQRSGITKFVREMQERGWNPEQIREVMQSQQQPQSSPQDDASGERVMTMEQFREEVRRLAREEATQANTQAQRQQGFALEQKSVLSGLEKIGVKPGPQQGYHIAAIQAILRDGLRDAQGNLIPGTACVDGQGRDMPASPELVQKAIDHYVQQIRTFGQQTLQQQLGPQPPAPPGTGTGAPAVASPAPKSFHEMTEQERKADMMAILRRGQNAGGVRSAAS